MLIIFLSLLHKAKGVDDLHTMRGKNDYSDICKNGYYYPVQELSLMEPKLSIDMSILNIDYLDKILTLDLTRHHGMINTHFIQGINDIQYLTRSINKFKFEKGEYECSIGNLDEFFWEFYQMVSSNNLESTKLGNTLRVKRAFDHPYQANIKDNFFNIIDNLDSTQTNNLIEVLSNLNRYRGAYKDDIYDIINDLIIGQVVDKQKSTSDELFAILENYMIQNYPQFVLDDEGKIPYILLDQTMDVDQSHMSSQNPQIRTSDNPNSAQTTKSTIASSKNTLEDIDASTISSIATSISTNSPNKDATISNIDSSTSTNELSDGEDFSKKGGRASSESPIKQKGESYIDEDNEEVIDTISNNFLYQKGEKGKPISEELEESGYATRSKGTEIIQRRTVKAGRSKGQNKERNKKGLKGYHTKAEKRLSNSICQGISKKNKPISSTPYKPRLKGDPGSLDEFEECDESMIITPDSLNIDHSSATDNPVQSTENINHGSSTDNTNQGLSTETVINPFTLNQNPQGFSFRPIREQGVTFPSFIPSEQNIQGLSFPIRRNPIQNSENNINTGNSIQQFGNTNPGRSIESHSQFGNTIHSSGNINQPPSTTIQNPGFSSQKGDSTKGSKNTRHSVRFDNTIQIDDVTIDKTINIEQYFKNSQFYTKQIRLIKISNPDKYAKLGNIFLNLIISDELGRENGLFLLKTLKLTLRSINSFLYNLNRGADVTYILDNRSNCIPKKNSMILAKNPQSKTLYICQYTGNTALNFTTMIFGTEKMGYRRLKGENYLTKSNNLQMYCYNFIFISNFVLCFDFSTSLPPCQKFVPSTNIFDKYCHFDIIKNHKKETALIDGLSFTCENYDECLVVKQTVGICEFFLSNEDIELYFNSVDFYVTNFLKGVPSPYYELIIGIITSLAPLMVYLTYKWMRYICKKISNANEKRKYTKRLRVKRLQAAKIQKEKRDFRRLKQKYSLKDKYSQDTDTYPTRTRTTRRPRPREHRRER